MIKLKHQIIKSNVQQYKSRYDIHNSYLKRETLYRVKRKNYIAIIKFYSTERDYYGKISHIVEITGNVRMRVSLRLLFGRPRIIFLKDNFTLD